MHREPMTLDAFKTARNTLHGVLRSTPLIHSPYLSEAVRASAEDTVKELGYADFTWIPTGCVITCHGGPGAFGIVAATN